MREKISSSFKKELYLCFTIVSIVPLLICFFFLIKLFDLKRQDDAQNVDLYQVNRLDMKLEHFYMDIEDVSSEITTNKVIISLLNEPDSASRNYVYSYLYDFSDELREYGVFNIYSKSGECLFTTDSDIPHPDYLTYWGILKRASESPERMIMEVDYSHIDSDENSLDFSRAIRDSNGNIIAYLLINVSKENFDYLLEDLISYNDGLVIFNEYWQQVYAGGPATDSEIDDVIRTEMLYSTNILDNYDNKNIYLDKINDELNFLYMTPIVMTESVTSAMIFVLLILAAGVTVINIFSISLIADYLTKPLTELSSAMNEVQKGNLDIRVDFERYDEYKNVADNFNEMTRELDNFLKSQIDNQKRLNDANIAMMQAQLNPHFLYNTLDTIKWVAKENNLESVASLSTKLAKILRTSISSSRFISLREEIALVRSYLDIQNFRFGNRYEYIFNITDEAYEAIIPKLIIQPLVENSIIHGFENQMEGIIEIDIYRYGNDLMIEVSDNGDGIDEKAMKMINEYHSSAEESIGLKNIKRILMLYFGNDYGLQAIRLEKGTRMVMKLPFRR